LFVLDIIGSGGAIEFFLYRLKELYDEAGIPLPPISLIAINTLKSGEHYDADTQQFIGKSLRVPALSLNLDSLAQLLDRMTSSYRITADFPALFWDSWSVDPFKMPVGCNAPIVLEAIKKEFGQKEKTE
jgi:hypothetical protein